jgi:hypothetical protein
MQQLVFPFPASRPAVSLWAAPAPVAPPSSSVVAAVLAFGDLRDDREDGLTLVRFSPERVALPDMQELLGADAARALDVSVLWDEREAEMVQVLDTAPLRRTPEAGQTGNAYADARMRGLRRHRPELELVHDRAA